MGFKTRFLSVLVGCLTVIGGFSLSVFAEGDSECSGKITGITAQNNVNTAITSFNSHPGGGAQDNAAVNLSVVGIADGLAPADREHAACVNKEAGNIYATAYEYAVKGWSWNTNLGFFSFSCKAGKNDAGLTDGLACGPIDYGVYTAAPVAGKRLIFGYAWSPSFGWIQFGYGWHAATSEWLPANNAKCKDATPCTNVTYLNADGTTVGYAWTQAGIYVNFAGLKMDLPKDGAVPDDGAQKWCPKDYICVEAVPDPSLTKPDASSYTDDSSDPGGDEDNDGIPNSQDPDFKVDVNDEIKIADGQDGYSLHLYLKDTNGDALENLPGFAAFANTIKFAWDDTVKINQTDGPAVGISLGSTKEPIKAKKGAIVWKPLTFTFADFKKVFEPNGSFKGHYVSNQLIRSFAPTSDANVSFTTATKPSYISPNEEFVYDVGATKVVEKNQLILKAITHGDLTQNGSVVLKQGSVYPNGKIGLSFKFRPAIMVDTLYAGILQDIISAYRSLSTNIKFGLTKVGNLPADSINTAKVKLILAYSKEKTKLQFGCGGDNPAVNNFDFHFLKDFSSNDLSNKTPSKTELQGEVVNIFGEFFDLPVVASLPEPVEGEDVSPCGFAQAPSLYSVISYNVSIPGDTVSVSYYNNKLPRGGGSEVFNPMAVVHGSLVGQAVADVRYGTVVETSGSVNVGTVRDAIYENLQKQVFKLTAPNPAQSCEITKLAVSEANASSTVSSNCAANSKKYFKVGTEHVLYFKGQNVHLKLAALNNQGNYSGRWVIVSDGGNIFIDKDIYSQNTDGKSVILVSLRDSKKFDSTGHVYIAPCNTTLSGPKNIQAAIIADGSVFPYTGKVDQLNANGEPEFSGNEERIYLSGCQLLIEGAIYSDNTIGGADLDKGNKPKNYVLLGGGEVVKTPVSSADRLRAQYYDLNYLRLFTLDLEVAENGCPIDQSCGKALCADDIVKIDKNEAVCGEYLASVTSASCGVVAKCNGINPFLKFEGNNSKGDLVVKASANVLAKGLNNNAATGKDFEPVYIFQKDFAKNSFVFTKAGGSNLGN